MEKLIVKRKVALVENTLKKNVSMLSVFSSDSMIVSKKEKILDINASKRLTIEYLDRTEERKEVGYKINGRGDILDLFLKKVKEKEKNVHIYSSKDKGYFVFFKGKSMEDVKKLAEDIQKTILKDSVIDSTDTASVDKRFGKKESLRVSKKDSKIEDVSKIMYPRAGKDWAIAVYVTLDQYKVLASELAERIETQKMTTPFDYFKIMTLDKKDVEAFYYPDQQVLSFKMNTNVSSYAEKELK